jgi:hypothetical protein
MKNAFWYRVGVAVCTAGVVLLTAATARAQRIATEPADAPSDAPQFMSRFDVHLTADATASGNKEFWMDSHFGGDFDLVDYGKGRFTLLADYQAVLGKEIRLFDPNQGNYLLEGSSSYRVGDAEIAGVFHHESRHLGDRAKIQAIAWNVLQVRLLYHHTFAGAAVNLRGDAGEVAQHSFVDYKWIADIEGRVDRPVAPHVAVYGSGYAETYGIRHDISARGRQSGGRVEGGVRLGGKRGSIDLFAGYERIVDADAFQQLPLSWAFAGFRVVNK